MSRTSRLLILLLTAGMAASPGFAQETAEVPFHLPTPKGWRTETIPFPLDFAPELEYEGLEELRFSPGMFTGTEVDYWSYIFVWWVPEDTSFSAQRLENDLEIYYRGLTEQVSRIREFDAGNPKHEAELKEAGSGDSDLDSWEGSVHTYDVFATRSAIRLLLRIDIRHCEEQGHLAAIFQLSPQPRRHKIWNVMGDVHQGFRCEK